MAQIVANIKTITKTTTGKINFYDETGIVVSVKENDEIQLNRKAWKLVLVLPSYTIQEGASNALIDVYVLELGALIDINGKSYTAISDMGSTSYQEKVLDAYDYLNNVIFVGCCNGSSVSSVQNYDNLAAFPVTGVLDVIYIADDTNLIYRWDGSTYVELGGAGTAGVASVTGNIVDNTDPLNPIVTQVQSDWNEADNTQPDYIKNKPDLTALPYIPLAGTNVGAPVTGNIQIKDLDGETFKMWYLDANALESGLAYLFQDLSNEQLQTSLYNNDVLGGQSISSATNYSAFLKYVNSLLEITEVRVVDGQVRISSSNSSFEGAKYNSDYSANFVLRSLIDQGYLKARFFTKAGTPTTTDDATAGYLVGSLIWDTTNSIWYRCTNNTNGAAVWTALTSSVAWGSITGTLSAQTDLQTALNGKEPTITAGTTAQYWRGDKTWQTLNGTAVANDSAVSGSTVKDALNTLNTGKEPTISSGTTAQYWRGDKTWQDFDAAAKAAVGYTINGNLGGGTIAASTTTYAPLASQNAYNATESTRRTPIAAASRVRYFAVYISSSQPASGSLVHNLRKNASNVSTITIAAGSAAGVYSSSTTSDWAQNDLATIQSINNATGTSAAINTFTTDWINL